MKDVRVGNCTISLVGFLILRTDAERGQLCVLPSDRRRRRKVLLACFTKPQTIVRRGVSQEAHETSRSGVGEKRVIGRLHPNRKRRQHSGKLKVTN
jgi:hypothetical protein